LADGGEQASIGVIGGSGFYSLLENVRERQVETPYGPPSDSLFLAELDGRTVAFLPRHGRRHSIPPHKINYRANIWALKSVGVRYLISPCAAGGLQPHVKPEHFVVCDQYVDRTRGRIDTFYDGPEVHHVSPADPYCPNLRKLAVEVIREHGITAHERGTMVVINGPRFSTKAESKWFSAQGWEVIGMTGYPEAYLALEQQIAVVNISLITDYDCGLFAEGTVDPVNATEVYAVFQKNAHRIKAVVLDLIRRIPLDMDSPHHHALEHAKVVV
jgi:5'-methylthioadenosine phosphorylase